MQHYPVYENQQINIILTDEDGNAIVDEQGNVIITGTQIVAFNQFALHANYLRQILVDKRKGWPKLKKNLLKDPSFDQQEIPFQELKANLTVWSDTEGRLVLKSQLSSNGKWSGLRKNLLDFRYNGWPQGDTIELGD